MHLIVGLGNPGETYAHTRHNAGADAVRAFARLCGGDWESDTYARGDISRCADGKTLCLIPSSYMNESGASVAACARKEEISPENIIVVHDDIDIPLGRVRISRGGGDGGHRGVASVAKSLGTKDFIRVRIGIAPHGAFAPRRPRGGEAVSRFVLKRFSVLERGRAEKGIRTGAEAIALVLKKGIAAAQNAFHRAEE